MRATNSVHMNMGATLSRPQQFGQGQSLDRSQNFGDQAGLFGSGENVGETPLVNAMQSPDGAPPRIPRVSDDLI